MADASLDLLIQIRDKLDGLDRTDVAIDKTKAKADGLGKSLESGLQVGAGIELARRGFDLLSNSIRATVVESINYATETRDISRNLKIGVEALQVFDDLVQDTGGNMELLTAAIREQDKVLAEAKRGGAGAAEAFRMLGLEVSNLEGMTTERRFEAIAKAIANSEDQTSALVAAQKILGTDNAPRLQEALRRLAADGYDKVAEAAKNAGKVMTDDTMGRLATAQKNIEALRKQAVIATGESLGFASRVVESGKQDFIGTLVGLLASFDPSSDLLRDVLAKNAPLKDGLDPDKKKPGLSASERNVNQLQFHLLTKQLQTAKELADVTKTESQQRAAVVKLLRDQADMLDQIRDIEYDDLKGFDTSGDITESELARWSQRNALEKEANGLRQQAKALSGGGLSAADRIRDKASGINDPANNDGFLEAGEGVTAGLQSWVVATGSTGQQIAATMQATVGGAISTLSTGIHGLATGTQSWGDVGRSVMSMLLQQLIQLAVQILFINRIQSALKIIGGGGATGPKIPGKATGGDVVPGQLYQVNEHNFAEFFTPSVPGRISPSQPLAPGGGGAGGSGGAPINVSMVLNVSTGVQQTVRAELVGMIPQLKNIAREGILEAQARGQMGR